MAFRNEFEMMAQGTVSCVARCELWEYILCAIEHGRCIMFWQCERLATAKTRANENKGQYQCLILLHFWTKTWNGGVLCLIDVLYRFGDALIRQASRTHAQTEWWTHVTRRKVEWDFCVCKNALICSNVWLVASCRLFYLFMPSFMLMGILKQENNSQSIKLILYFQQVLLCKMR